MQNADLIKILETRLAEAREGKIVDMVAVFGVGGSAFTTPDESAIPRLVGEFEMFKLQLTGMYLQRIQQRAQGIVPVRGASVPPMSPELWKKMNEG